MSSRAVSNSRKAASSGATVATVVAEPGAETQQLSKTSRAGTGAGTREANVGATASPWVIPLFVATTDDPTAATDFLSLFPRAFMDGTELIITPANVSKVPTLYSEELCQAACRTANHRLCSQTDVQMQLYGPYIRSISLMFMREAMHDRMTFNDVAKQYLALRCTYQDGTQPMTCQSSTSRMEAVKPLTYHFAAIADTGSIAINLQRRSLSTGGYMSIHHQGRPFRFEVVTLRPIYVPLELVRYAFEEETRLAMEDVSLHHAYPSPPKEHFDDHTLLSFVTPFSMRMPLRFNERLDTFPLPDVSLAVRGTHATPLAAAQGSAARHASGSAGSTSARSRRGRAGAPVPDDSAHVVSSSGLERGAGSRASPAASPPRNTDTGAGADAPLPSMDDSLLTREQRRLVERIMHAEDVTEVKDAAVMRWYNAKEPISTSPSIALQLALCTHMVYCGSKNPLGRSAAGSEAGVRDRTLDNLSSARRAADDGMPDQHSSYSGGLTDDGFLISRLTATGGVFYPAKPSVESIRSALTRLKRYVVQYPQSGPVVAMPSTTPLRATALDVLLPDALVPVAADHASRLMMRALYLLMGRPTAPHHEYLPDGTLTPLGWPATHSDNGEEEGGSSESRAATAWQQDVRMVSNLLVRDILSLFQPTQAAVSRQGGPGDKTLMQPSRHDVVSMIDQLGGRANADVGHLATVALSRLHPLDCGDEEAGAKAGGRGSSSGNSSAGGRRVLSKFVRGGSGSGSGSGSGNGSGSSAGSAPPGGGGASSRPPARGSHGSTPAPLPRRTAVGSTVDIGGVTVPEAGSVVTTPLRTTPPEGSASSTSPNMMLIANMMLAARDNWTAGDGATRPSGDATLTGKRRRPGGGGGHEAELCAVSAASPTDASQARSSVRRRTIAPPEDSAPLPAAGQAGGSSADQCVDDAWCGDALEALATASVQQSQNTEAEDDEYLDDITADGAFMQHGSTIATLDASQTMPGVPLAAAAAPASMSSSFPTRGWSIGTVVPPDPMARLPSFMSGQYPLRTLSMDATQVEVGHAHDPSTGFSMSQASVDNGTSAAPLQTPAADGFSSLASVLSAVGSPSGGDSHFSRVGGSVNTRAHSLSAPAPRHDASGSGSGSGSAAAPNLGDSSDAGGSSGGSRGRAASGRAKEPAGVSPTPGVRSTGGGGQLHRSPAGLTPVTALSARAEDGDSDDGGVQSVSVFYAGASMAPTTGLAFSQEMSTC